MITDKFGALLQELGKIFNAKITPDKNNACLLKFQGGIEVQIEPAKGGDSIIICTEVAQIPPGRFRENVFREALKSNGLPPPHKGIFAFGKKLESLVLFDKIAIDDTSGQKLAEYLVDFITKAGTWKLSIARGDIPSYIGAEGTYGEKVKAAGGLFGLIR